MEKATAIITVLFIAWLTLSRLLNLLAFALNEAATDLARVRRGWKLLAQECERLKRELGLDKAKRRRRRP
jgi:hypothetical protein